MTMNKNTATDRGGILLFAVIAIAFLSGLAAYIQAMSDPALIHTADTKQILTEDNLTDSMGIILSELTYNDDSIPKVRITDITDPDAFVSLLTSAANKFKLVYLFSNDSSLLTTATKVAPIDDIDIGTGNDIFIKGAATGTLHYTVKTPYNESKNKDIKLYIKLP